MWKQNRGSDKAELILDLFNDVALHLKIIFKNSVQPKIINIF